MIICFAKKAGQTFLGYWYLLLPGGSFADFKIQLGDFKLAKHHIPLAKNRIPQATNIPYQSLLIKTIFSVLAHTDKQFFSKLVFQCFKQTN